MIGKEVMFYVTFRRYKKGKVTPIKEKYKRKFELMLFREKVLKSYQIGIHSKRFSAHHLLPKYLFPDRECDPNNGIPIIHELHELLHQEYSNPELVIDPIMSIVKILKF